MNRKAFLACVLMCVILTGCETAKKISEVIKNPDIQVGSLKEQPSEITVTLLTEPDTNTNAEGESAAVDVQLVYLTDDSKLQAADYDQIASTPLPDVLGKNYIDHQDFNLLPDTIKTLPPIKLDEKTQFIGVVAYFSDDQATEWKQIETVGKRLVRTVLIFTESSDQLSRATDRVPGLPAS
uniref:type VI secretion system lipoprotein TssJ n=2 Tax=Escherichia coli TaxID=562 RepID=UPI002551244B